MRVLVATDDDRLARALSRALRAHGYATEQARGVAEARLALAQVALAAVLVDLDLGGGGGLALLRDLRDRPGTAVLAVSRRAAGAAPGGPAGRRPRGPPRHRRRRGPRPDPPRARRPGRAGPGGRPHGDPRAPARPGVADRVGGPEPDARHAHGVAAGQARRPGDDLDRARGRVPAGGGRGLTTDGPRRRGGGAGRRGRRRCQGSPKIAAGSW